ncbi:hypothetical protein [Anatilimnocola floriformis]|uniref:hypothetical protein n=1 Tax=Anatilimnocola floriformis TaxID=2948575 RepID=UPI0020C49650|nr:hypothetical protein [Anatilimnocola floriformis]
MRNDPRPDPWAPNLTLDIQRSATDRLADDRLLTLLTFYSAGDLNVLPELLSGLRWLVYEHTHDAEHVGSACAALGDALDRLRAHDHVDAAEVLKYLRAEIGRSYIDYRREVSPNLLAPASTKSSRKSRAKKAGKEAKPIHEPKREWRDAALIGDDGSTWLDNEANPSVPSSMRGHSMATDFEEMMDHVARSPFERDVMERRLEGESIRDIARDLGVSKYQIESLCSLFKRRAEEVL